MTISPVGPKPSRCPHCDEIIWGYNSQYKSVFDYIRYTWPVEFTSIIKYYHKNHGYIGEGQFAKVLKLLREIGVIEKTPAGNYKPREQYVTERI